MRNSLADATWCFAYARARVMKDDARLLDCYVEIKGKCDQVLSRNFAGRREC